jgi:hypothetical protein
VSAAPATSRSSSGDLVPLSERLVYLRVLRAVIALTTVLDAALLPHQLRKSFVFVAFVALGYVVVSWGLEGVWRLLKDRGQWVFGFMLMIDGVYLAGANYLAGGTTGPVRYLVLVYLAAITLLGSYRTGVKVALWQSLMQFTVFYAQKADILSGFNSNNLTLTTATLSAVSER